MTWRRWYYVLLIPVLIFAVKYPLKTEMWNANGPVMLGKTVIITGANSGIGFGTASELARYGAKVILACRNKTKAEKARQDIISQLKSQDNVNDLEQRLVVEELDLASFDSIRAFAERMQQLNGLDVLVNNAAVGFFSDKQLTKDGLEMTMGTNHFGHFLLTNLLLPLLKKSAPSRIIGVTSMMYTFGNLEFDNLNSERSYGRYVSFANSKLANILFTRELARRLEGTGVVANVLQPGAVNTEAARNFPKVLGAFYGLLSKLFFKTPIEGAQTSVYLAASHTPDVLESGRFFSECKLADLKPVAMDDATAQKLWQASERITRLV